MNGFRSTGLWSFNDQMFTDEDFIAANLTEEGPTDTNISTAVTDLSSLKQHLRVPNLEHQKKVNQWKF